MQSAGSNSTHSSSPIIWISRSEPFVNSSRYSLRYRRFLLYRDHHVKECIKRQVR